MARILVVDDEKSVRVFLREFLKEEGHQVVTVENATQALERLKEEAFDVVVTDIVMPRVSGVELLKQVNLYSPDSKVVMITGDPNLETAVAAVRAGAFDYVSKPVGREEIIQVVARAVELKELEDEKRRLEEENRRHREELEELVAERTEALRKSEERLVQLGKAVESSSDAIGIASPGGVVSYLNSAFQELSGYTPELIMERGGIPAFYTSQDTAVEMLEIVKGGESWIGELELITREGRIIPIVLRADAIKDETGRITGLMGIHTDISERKAAQEEIRRTGEKFRNIFQNANDGMAFIDRHGIIREANDRAVELFGGTREGLIGKYFTRIGIFRAKNIPNLLKAFASSIANRTLSTELTISNKDDRTLTLSCTTAQVQEDGKVTGIIAIAHNVTEERAAQEREKENLRNMEFLAQCAMELVELPDAVDIYQFITEKMRQLVEDAVIVVSQVDEEADQVTLRGISGLGKNKNKIMKLLRMDPVGKVFKATVKGSEELRGGNLVKMEGDFHELSSGTIPKAASKAIMTLLKVKGIYSIDLLWKDQVFGNVAILAGKGTSFENRNTIETFIRQCAVALQRSQAQEALCEEERKYRELFENANEAIFVAQDGFFRFWNPRTQEILGYSDEELGSSYFVEFIHPGDRKRVMGYYQDRMKGEEAPQHYSCRIITSAGETRWMELGVVRVDWNGNPASLCFVSDITEREKAAEALKESEELYRKLVENAPTGVISVDTEGNVLSVNPKILEILGSPSAEATKAINLFTFPPLIESGIAEAFRECMKTDKVLSSEQHYTSKWGASRYVHFHLVPLHDSSGAVSGVLANVEDISARLMAQVALEESERKYRGLVERARDGVYILQGPRFAYVNDAFCEIFGYSREELMEMEDFMELVDEESRDLVRTRDQKLRAGEELPFHYEFAGRKGNGKTIHLEASITPIIYKGVRARQGWVQDITQRKEHEEQLMNVITNTSHLINTPLTVALGQMDLVSLGLKDMTPDLAGMVHTKLMKIRELVVDGLARNIALLTKKTSDGWTPVGERGNGKSSEKRGRRNRT